MTTQSLQSRLDAIVRRDVRLRSLSGIGWTWLVLGLVAWGIVGGLQPVGLPLALFWLAVPAAAVGLAFVMASRARQQRPTRQQIARRIEQIAPHVDARLITAIEQAPDLQTGRFNVLQQQVMTEASAFFRPEWPQQLVPRWKLAGSTGLIVCDLALLLGVLYVGGFSNGQPLSAALLATASPARTVDLPIVVEPGNAEIERGMSLLVIARFNGTLPNQVRLVQTPKAGGPEILPLTKALDDPVFGTRISAVQDDFTYVVEYDNQQTQEYRITVFDLPQLQRADIVVQSPEYTGQPQQRYPNAHDVTVVEQSQVTIECRVNKPLAAVALLDKDNAPRAMQRSEQDPLLWTTSWVPEKSARLKLALTDEQERTNRDPDQFRIEVVPNRPPRLELTFPGKDVQVSPLEELMVEGQAVDDFGLIEYGLVVAVAGREPVTVPLGANAAANRSQAIAHLQAMEELKVMPDDLVSYFLYAVDRGPDGQPRKVTSDLFFAEVRPFEETFRQLESPPGGGAGAQGGQSPQGNQFENLIQVQKQIVSATWNVIRNSATNWNQKTDEQLTTVSQSQTGNKTRLLEMMTQFQDAAQQRIAGVAVDQMTAATEQLGASAEERSSGPLDQAVVAEQAAYRQLLKLRARDHLVMQSQQSGGGGSSGGASPSEQQLQQLELSDRQNRYETQRSAGEQSTSAQQEDLGTLDRLKELARRQGDLNQKLRELDAALRLAGTPQEKEEIERQLKRLRDEQQQLLQDADELRNRLAQSQRQEQFQETRDQLEETRRRMVDATEALQEGQLSQALSSTSRAERDLQSMQQEFRQQTSARFAEAMRSLRESAREIAEQQQKLSEELAGKQPQTERRSLREDRTSQDLSGDFEQQRTDVTQLLDRARQIVQEAETAEPLLAQQLYDTIRKTREDQLEPALEAVPQLLQRGFMPEAQQAEEQARRGLERLQAGVDQAAESVLGSEVESLKRAKAELAELSQILQDELRQQMQREAGDRAGNSAEGEESAAGPGNTPAGEREGGGTSAPGTPMSESRPGQNGNPSNQNPSDQNPGDDEKTGAGVPGGSGQPSSSEMPGQGGASGNREGPQPGDSQQPGQPGSGQGGAGQQPGQGQQGQGQQGQGQGQSAAGGSAGEEGGQGSGSGGGSQPGDGEGAQPGMNGNGPGGLRGNDSSSSAQGGAPSPGGMQGGRDRGGMAGGPGGQGGPMSGEGYREWAERLRDVETMVNDPDLQAEVSRIREQARSLRAESQRHSKSPNWNLVQSSLYEPLVELQRRLAEEVAKRESDDALVPIDRDPVPARYKDLVRTYYERLGQGKE